LLWRYLSRAGRQSHLREYVWRIAMSQVSRIDGVSKRLL
jgi:hypothetical protein